MPLVTSVSSTLKRQYIMASPFQAEEMSSKRAEMIDVVDNAIAQFKEKLDSGYIKIDSIGDLERLVKLMLLLTGEPDRLVGLESPTEDNDTVGVLQMIDRDSPEMKALYEKVSNQLNVINDSV